MSRNTSLRALQLSAGSKCHQPLACISRPWRAYSTQKDTEHTDDTTTTSNTTKPHDPRLKPTITPTAHDEAIPTAHTINTTRIITSDYALLRPHYQTPTNPIILAHGLFGFSSLHLAGPHLPGIHYWRGITEALTARGITVFTASVPPSGSIEARAKRLAESIETMAKGRSVNIVAHSMGGLDARYMISCLKPAGVDVRSLTTVATPHWGSSVADFVFERVGERRVRGVLKAMEGMGIETGAFKQLTRGYMAEVFNPQTRDVDGVRYYSYGARFAPRWWSLFWTSGRVCSAQEGDNDGLVSVESSKWGTYQGTLEGVSHLDLINWTNRLRWFLWEIMGGKREFNAVAFYLHIADMLAEEGL